MPDPAKVAALKRKTAALIGEVSEAEMACRIMEAAHQMPRPLGLTAEQALNALDAQSRVWGLQMARAAIGYVQECLANARTPS